MKPVLVNGETWHVGLAPANDPTLVDRTGKLALATTDPITHVITLSEELTPPLIDQVLLHEVAHAITVSYGLLPISSSEIGLQEWTAEFLGHHAIEAVDIASKILERPVCIHGLCLHAVTK